MNTIECGLCHRQAKWIGNYGEFRIYKCECGEELQTQDGIPPFGIIYETPPPLKFLYLIGKYFIEYLRELSKFEGGKK